MNYTLIDKILEEIPKSYYFTIAEITREYIKRNNDVPYSIHALEAEGLIEEYLKEKGTIIEVEPARQYKRSNK